MQRAACDPQNRPSFAPATASHKRLQISNRLEPSGRLADLFSSSTAGDARCCKGGAFYSVHFGAAAMSCFV